MSQDDTLIFGGTGRTGLEIARRLRQRGDQVTVVARVSSDISDLEAIEIKIVNADAFNVKELKDAMASARCCKAICSLGNRPGAERKIDYEGVRNAVDAAEAASITRFILISSLGCGDSRPALSERALKFLGDVCLRKTQGEDYLKSSGLDWTIIRPGGLSSDPPTGKAVLSEDPLSFGTIRRGDVARLSVLCLDDSDTIGRTYSAIDPSLGAN